MNKKILKKLGFAKYIDLVESGKCPFCKKNVNIKDFRDELSRKEFKLSGLCQNCIDIMFLHNPEK